MSSSWVLTIAVALVSLSVAASEDCPPSVSKPAGTTYSQKDGSNCYAFVSSPTVYSEANTACRNKRGILVKISSQEKNIFTARLIREGGNFRGEVWTGLNSGNRRGVLLWNGISSAFYKNYASGHEGNIITSGMTCVSLNSVDLKWRKYNCQNPPVAKPFVCQLPA